MARHLLETKDFSKEEIEGILDLAQSYLDSKNALNSKNALLGHIVITIFLKTPHAHSQALKLQQNA